MQDQKPGPQKRQGHPTTPGCLTIPAVLLAAALSAFLLLLAGEFVLRGMGAVLVTADPLEKADAAVILSGGDNTRIDEAALLYKEEWMDFVILTETGVSVPEWNTDYSNLMRFEAIQKGIPANAILISEQHVDSTADEARATLKLMNTRGFHTLIVITDPYHTLRTRLIFRDIFPEGDIKVIVHPVRNHWYQSKTWWHHLEGWKVTILEYIKLAAYFLGLR